MTSLLVIDQLRKDWMSSNGPTGKAAVSPGGETARAVPHGRSVHQRKVPSIEILPQQKMRRIAAAVTLIALLAAIVSACGGSKKTPVNHAQTNGPASSMRLARKDVVLTVAGLGTFEGRCPRGARSWTLRFVVDNGEATDTLSYRIGTTTRRTVNVDPGNAITFHLAPNLTRTHEPADRFVPPLGQGRGLSAPTSVPTTAPLQALIYQGTEPQTLRADVRLALTTIGGESGQCVLVGSTVNAYTYPNS
jgi:hypothetical protein